MADTIAKLLDAWYRERGSRTGAALGRGLGERAGDLLHDAVVDLLERPPSSIRNPVGYLLTAVRSLARDGWRREATTARVHEELSWQMQGSSGANRHDGRADEGLLEAVLALPEPCRDALVLNRIEGLTHREIAVHQGTSVRTVRRRIDQALESLLELQEPRDG